MKNLITITLLFLSVTLITGCGSGNLPLSGKVTFEDGTPLTLGTVCFESATVLARGELKPDGTYIVGTQSAVDGLPPGQYNVYVTGAAKILSGGASAGEPRGGGIVLDPLIDKKFASGRTSGLTFTADGKSKTFDFNVTPPKGKKK